MGERLPQVVRPRRVVQVDTHPVRDEPIVDGGHSVHVLEPETVTARPVVFGKCVVGYDEVAAIHEERADRVPDEVIAGHRCVVRIHEVQAVPSVADGVVRDLEIVGKPEDHIAALGHGVARDSGAVALPQADAVTSSGNVQILGPHHVVGNDRVGCPAQEDSEENILENVVRDGGVRCIHREGGVLAVDRIAGVADDEPADRNARGLDVDRVAFAAGVDDRPVAPLEADGLVDDDATSIDAGVDLNQVAGACRVDQGLEIMQCATVDRSPGRRPNGERDSEGGDHERNPSPHADGAASAEARAASTKGLYALRWYQRPNPVMTAAMTARIRPMPGKAMVLN